MLLLFTFIFGFLKNVRISYDNPTLKESVAGISQWLTNEGKEKYVSSSVGLCGNIRYDNLFYIEHGLDNLCALVFWFLGLRLSPAHFPEKDVFVSSVFLQMPTTTKTDCIFGGTKSRSAREIMDRDTVLVGKRPTY